MCDCVCMRMCVCGEMQVIDRELIRNLLLAMGAVFIVTLLLLADLLASLYVLACVALTVVSGAVLSLA